MVIDRVSLPVPPQSAEQLVSLIEEKLRKDTAVVSISEVTSTTGLRMPIARIAEVVRANGSLLVVDGAQTPGALQVDVKQLDCDAYATSAVYVLDTLGRSSEVVAQEVLAWAMQQPGVLSPEERP